MKKMIICSITTVALSVGAIFFWQKIESAKLTPIQLANIEALADGEKVSTITAECLETLASIKICSVTCPRCFTEWSPKSKPIGVTQIQTIKGQCACGYTF